MTANYKKLEFINGEIYHVYNRGVEKRNIFTDDNDHFRFIFSLYECNDQKPVIMRDRIFQRKERSNQSRPSLATVSRHPTSGHYDRQKNIDILAFCLMPNHYHLILRQLCEGGISQFMRKLGDSYVKYFNDKHSRKGMGSLFQGKFKAKHVDNDDQFKNLITYIHANPVGIIEKNWKEKGIQDIKSAIEFLNDYRWSSYLDYIGKDNFKSVAKKDFALKMFAASNESFAKNGSKNMQFFLSSWLKYKEKLSSGLSKI